MYAMSRGNSGNTHNLMYNGKEPRAMYTAPIEAIIHQREHRRQPKLHSTVIMHTVLTEY